MHGEAGPVGGRTDASTDLRTQAASKLMARRGVVVADTVAVFPPRGPLRLDADYCTQLGDLVVRLLAEAVRSGTSDARSSGISELAGLVDARGLPPSLLYEFVHLALNTSLDELSLDSELGATTEPWPEVAQTVRRATFDVLAAWTTRALSTPAISSTVDALTTLETRALFEAALAKECYRSERFEHWMSMILIDVDNLAEINRVHGFGVGDRILERMGILLKSFFRQHDWVARYGEDAVAVLLPETSPADAAALAERTRVMVQERLTFRDYRTDQRAAVTVSVAVVCARALEGEPIDAVRFLAEAESAVTRAKISGRNRVEHVELPPRLISVEEAAVVLGTDLEGIERLVGDGRLEPVQAGRHIRLDRAAVLALAGGQTAG
ncbi:MAG: diguanylate cyclase [Acidobacteriota bacterium]